MNHEYTNPLSTRYASKEMLELFSDNYKHLLWRRIWLNLALAQKKLGLNISSLQINELKSTINNIDYELVAQLEAELRHDIMAHMNAWKRIAPEGGKILHLGATSAEITDNADVIIFREALELILSRLIVTLRHLKTFSLQFKDLACLGYTHYQPAQPTTYGKRATLWAQDLALDIAQLVHILKNLKLRGIKGTTGTAASYLQLLGDEAKVDLLEREFVKSFGFNDAYPVTGQTYPRKLDDMILSVLGGIGQSASKFANDIRLLSHDGEVQEPFTEKQIGSSAMAYKRNPMRTERMVSLSRYLIHLRDVTADTAANQWLERTLDDSASRRLVIPQAFLTTEAILILYINVISGLKLNPNVIANRLNAELPFMLSEALLMEATAAGGDRQTLHEIIRVHSLEARKRVFEADGINDLLARLSNDPAFPLDDSQIQQTIANSKYTGLATEQTESFWLKHINPLLAQYSNIPDFDAKLSV